MRFGEKEVRQSIEIELHGVLQKKNRKGFYQNRYLRTCGSYLQYWSSYEEYLNNKEISSSSYDIREIKIVEILNDGYFYIQFMNEKFRLELRAISFEQSKEWVDFLNAKKVLHSTNSLLTDPNIGNSFKTNTFNTLLKLSTTEQDRWINDFLNDAFEIIYDHRRESAFRLSSATTTTTTINNNNNQLDDESVKMNMFQKDAKAVLGACKACLEDLTVTCEECTLEMTCRIPQVIAQCRDYMHRYADLFKSRLSLELQSYFSITRSIHEIHALGDECLIEAICFFQSLDSLRKHKFLPRNFFSAIRDNLYNADQLTREYLKLLVIRNELWYSELYQLQPRQRGQKLCEYYKIVDYQIKKIDETFVICDLYDMKSKQTLLMMTIDTLAISLARLVSKTNFDGYGEDALLGHIIACQECVRYFSTLKLSRIESINSPIIDRNRSYSITSNYSENIYSHQHQHQHYQQSSLQSQSQPQYQNSPHFSNDNNDDNDDDDESSHNRIVSRHISNKTNITNISSSQSVLALSKSCIEQLGSMFLQSATNAAISAVRNMSLSTQDIVNMFLIEKGVEWIGGKVCKTYIDRISSWMEGFCQRGSTKPCEFHRIVRRETIRLVVVTYFRKIIEKYRSNKRFKLSGAGEMQVAHDLQAISRWVEIQNEKLTPSNIQDQGSYAGSNDITMIIRNIRMFMTSDESNLMLCFFEAIQHFGISSAPHLYDLARLSFKIRSDLTPKVRLHILSCFSSYIEQLNQTFIEDLGPLSNPHPRLSGPEILKELCPQVGIYHCTGKKWSYQVADMNVKLEMANLVTDACNVARIRKLGFSETSNQSNQLNEQPKILTKEDSNSYDGWQLLDADSLKSSSLNPLDNPHRSMTRSELYGISRQLTSISDAIDNISMLDNIVEEKAEESSIYNYDSKRPLIDLYGCSFEELHMNLCPPMYLRKSTRKYVFISSVRPEEHSTMTSPDIFNFESKTDNYLENDIQTNVFLKNEQNNIEIKDDDDIDKSNDKNNNNDEKLKEKTQGQDQIEIVKNKDSDDDDDSDNDNDNNNEQQKEIKEVEKVEEVEVEETKKMYEVEEKYEEEEFEEYEEQEEIYEINSSNNIDIKNSSSQSQEKIQTNNEISPIEDTNVLPRTVPSIPTTVNSDTTLIIPPLKPPKPQRYSISLSNNLESLESENNEKRMSVRIMNNSNNMEIAEQLRIAQEQLPERYRVSSISL